MRITDIKYILVGIVLLYNAITDIKRKEIVPKSLMAGGIICIIFLWQESSVTILDCLGGMGVGAFLMLVSLITKEQIGKGDGLVFLFTGLVLGFWDNLFLMMYSLAAVFVYMMILCLRKGFVKEQRVAFIPFVCIGYIGVLCL